MLKRSIAPRPCAALSNRKPVDLNPAGFSLLIIFFATFGMFSDPLGDSLFGSEALDYFRLTIRPKNVYHPAESGVFPRHESGPMLGHLPNMRLRRAGFKPCRTFKLNSRMRCHLDLTFCHFRGGNVCGEVILPARCSHGIKTC
jgi:hypothetical protein